MSTLSGIFKDKRDEEAALRNNAPGGGGTANKTAATIVVGVGGSTLNTSRADIVVPAGATNAAPYIQRALDALPTIVVHAGRCSGGGNDYVDLDWDGTVAILPDWYAGCEVTITSGTGAGQTRRIQYYGRSLADGGGARANVSVNWTTNPDDSSHASVTRKAGRVVLLEGRYPMRSSIYMDSGMTLEGQGPGSLLFTNWDGWGANSAMIRANPDAGGGNVRAGSSHICIANLAVLNNDESYALNNGIRGVYGPSHSIIHNVSLAGLQTGVNAQNGNHLLVTDSRLDHSSYGVSLLSFANATISDCHMGYLGYGVLLWISSHNVVANCRIMRVVRHAVWIDEGAHNNLVTGNHITDGYRVTTLDDCPSQILISDISHRNVITNNVARLVDKTDHAKGVALYIEDVGGGNECDRTLVSGNDFYLGGINGAIRNDGTNTSFGAGNRVNDGSWLVGADYTPP